MADDPSLVAYRNLDKRVNDFVMGHPKANGKPRQKVYVDYSAYESDDNDVPIDNLDEVAVAGKVQLRQPADNFWGGQKARDYESPVLESPTWLEVCRYADDMIRRTRDTHHCFLEGLDLEGETNGIKIYSFSMGS